jgi:hypothetical protein
MDAGTYGGLRRDAPNPPYKLVAPIAGVVKYLKLTTIGGVLRAGDELMQCR